jgi:hypothetical protein
MKASRLLTGIVRAGLPVRDFFSRLEVLRNLLAWNARSNACRTTTRRGSRMTRAKVEMKLSRRGEVFGENGFDRSNGSCRSSHELLYD